MCTRNVLHLVVSSRFSSVVLVKFSLCINARKILAHFRPRRGRGKENLVEPSAYCNQVEWLKGLDDTSPTNEAEGKTTTSASRMKLLENGNDSETSTTRESGADDVDLEISSFWLARHGFKKMSNEEA